MGGYVLNQTKHDIGEGLVFLVHMIASLSAIGLFIYSIYGIDMSK